MAIPNYRDIQPVASIYLGDSALTTAGLDPPKMGLGSPQWPRYSRGIEFRWAIGRPIFAENVAPRSVQAAGLISRLKTERESATLVS
jgi:hypothetical protein